MTATQSCSGDAYLGELSLTSGDRMEGPGWNESVMPSGRGS